MQAYLFVHFKEKRTPDGEQVYFGVSKDGFHWEEINGGNPVLWSYYGDKGVRDCTIIRTKDNKFAILATDLSLSYGMLNQYNHSWDVISKNGSKCLSFWESEDLISWSRQKLIKFGNDDFGCLWAPDIIYDKKNDDYVIHWSSAHRDNNFGPKGIYYSRTKDFTKFSEARLLYRKEDSGVIDSAIYEENGKYYMFLKSEHAPAKTILLEAEDITGPYSRIEEFDKSMEATEAGLYEGATAVRLENGQWCLFLDFYGGPPEVHGYVPFIADDLASGKFVRSDESFSFPYGYKHGTLAAITIEEYERLKAYKKPPSEH